METTCSDAGETILRSGGESGTALRMVTDKISQGGAGVKVERGAVHCLPGGDTETRSPHYRLPYKPMADWETP